MFKYFLSLLFIAGIGLHAANLKYEQDVTLTNWVSEEHTKHEAELFCRAAANDPNIKVVNIRYKKKQEGKDREGNKMYSYHAIITCHVSEIDTDLMRINGKTLKLRQQDAS